MPRIETTASTAAASSNAVPPQAAYRIPWTKASRATVRTCPPASPPSRWATATAPPRVSRTAGSEPTRSPR